MKEAKAIDVSALVTATGGMNLDGMRLSTNVEDRRTKAGKARDAAWWAKTHPQK